MEPTSTTLPDLTGLSDDELAAQLREARREQPDPLSSDRASRFYDRIRSSIERFVAKQGKVAGTTTEFLLLVPDVFILLWRLVTDARVSGKDKVLIGSALAYFVLPFDIIPEGLVGPMGYLDDLVFGAFVLHKVLGNTDAEVLRAHWSGRQDVLASITKVLDAAENLVSSDVMAKIRKMMK
ncbi:MAG: YkvA family protein [Thermoanaerobaculia bacterium]